MNKREVKTFKPVTSHYKILETVDLLNKEHYYPLPEGIGKILKGKEDDETLPFKQYPTYQTLISYSSKKICRYVMMLVRYKYLAYILDRETNELYLRITELGREALSKYLKKYRPHFKKRVVTKKKTIVKID